MRVRRGRYLVAGAAISASVLVGLIAPQAARADDSAAWSATLLDGALAPAAVSTDSAGDLYVAGAYDGEVHEFSPTGTPITSFSTLGLGLNQITAVAVSGSSVYVAERVGGGLGTGTIVDLNATTGAIQSQFSATAANLATPLGLAANGSGVWVTTEDSRGIVRLNPTTGGVQAGFSVDVTTHTIDPVGLALDSTGDLYVANAECSTASSPVIKVTASTGAAVASFASSGDTIGLGQAVAIDTAGDVLVSTATCSGPNHGVDVLDPTTGATTGHLLDSDAGVASAPGDVAYLFSSATPGLTKYSIATDTADSSFLAGADPLGLAMSVAVDPSGGVYVADSLASTIDKFNATNGAQETYGNTHDAIAPNAVTTFGKNVYLAGAPNNRVVELNNTGSALVGSSPAVDLTNPAMITVADADHIFEVVTDSSRIVDRNPIVGPVYSGFSVASDGLTNIAGITADNEGHLFVTEACPTNAIVELDATTGAVLQTIPSANAGGIQCPRAVAADDAGHLFVVGLNSSLDAEVVELSTADDSVVSSFDVETVTGGLNVGGSIAVTTDDQVFLAGQAGLVRVDPTSATPPVTVTVVAKGAGSGTVTGSGISCPTTCSSSYPSGTSVLLTATPASNSTFAGWSGACTGHSTCALTPTAAATVTATFQKIAAPNTKLVSKSIVASKGTATFTFSSTGATTSFQCAVALTSATLHFNSCSSPTTYLKLAKGHYRFEVRAVGPGGTDASPASTTFTI